MVTGVVGVMSLILWAFLCMVADVECSWAWEWDRDNYSPVNRYPVIPHVGVRRSIFDRFWGETTPNNPFLPTRPSAPRILPRLSGNDFIVTDNDYEEDSMNSHWFPQTQHSLKTKSLEGLQHILEGRLGPMNDPSPSGPRKYLKESSHKDEKEKKQRNKQRKFRQHFIHQMSPSSSSGVRSGGSTDRNKGLHPLPNFGVGSFAPDEHFMTSDQDFSKDILHDFQEPLRMPESFTNTKQFPKDFIAHEQFPQEFGLPEPSLPNDHLTTDPFLNALQVPEAFEEHLLLSPLSSGGDFPNPDNLLNLHADQTLGEVNLPPIFPNLGILGHIDPPDTLIHQDRLGHFRLPNAKSPDILLESGKGLEWLPPALSDLNLPSHSQLTSSLEQKLSKEAHRDACHSHNLHSCGSRVIDEFAVRPDNPDKCRIREEFLDCMEQAMKRPCELHGEQYSRQGTKLIRDKIKMLLWSAQGCILGYST